MGCFTEVPTEVVEFIAFLAVVPDCGEMVSLQGKWGGGTSDAARERSRSEKERAAILMNLR
jgi:hypothetical protein